LGQADGQAFIIPIFALTTKSSFPFLSIKNYYMKKIFVVLAVAGLLVACGNDAGSDKETKEPPKEVSTDTNPDTSKTMTNPSHNMMPPDSGGTERREISISLYAPG
jgi:hypothetical protein